MGYLKHLIKQIFIHNPWDAMYERAKAKHIKKGDYDVWQHHLYWRLGKRISTAVCRLLNKITWNDRDEILPKGPFVVVANHVKAIDPLYIGTTMWWKVAWLSKEANFKTPIMKTAIGAMGAISMVQKGDDAGMNEASWAEVDHAIKRKHAIGIFPEGHRSKNGILQAFHTGAARLCLKYNIPYIPVAIYGSRKPFKGQAHVVIGTPVYLQTMECTYDIAQEIADDMRKQVQYLLTTKNPEGQPKSRFEQSFVRAKFSIVESKQIV